MPNAQNQPADPALIDSRTAAWRLLTVLGLVTLGNSGMYVVAVVLPEVQAEFGVSRGDASLPYTLMMVCLGLGGLITGRLADRHGITPVLRLGAFAVAGGFVWASLSGSIWSFGLAHGLLLGLLGSSATFAPLLADTALWWNKRRGIAVAIAASGNYVAGTVWPPLVQWGIETIGWRQTYLLLGLTCGIGIFLLANRMRQRPPLVITAPVTPGDTLPADFTPELMVTRHYAQRDFPFIFTNGVQASYVEVDPDTGFVKLLKHWAVEDCGRVLNPMLVDEQMRGAIVQGIGGALFEECLYDEQGLMLNANMADYLVPMSAEMPDIEVAHVMTPTRSSKLGAKGAGEAGTAGAPAAVMNAINDAIAPFGATVHSQPITPQKVLRALGKVT
jgi:hypothetical protein